MNVHLRFPAVLSLGIIQPFDEKLALALGRAHGTNGFHAPVRYDHFLFGRFISVYTQTTRIMKLC